MADVVEPGAGAAGAWHADGELLAAYAAGRLDVAGTWSVEAHVTSCAGCRELAGALAEPERLRRGRAAVIAAVDVPHAGVAERLLVRLGVPDYTARLLAATPALRGSWLLAVATTLAFAVLAARLGSGRDASLAFLTVAPLLPLAGIAVAYGPGIDPTYEIGLAAPMRSFKLLLLAWVAAVLVTVQPPGPSSVLFAVPGQAAFAILGLLAAVVVLLRRGRFESDRAFDTTPRFAARRLR